MGTIKNKTDLYVLLISLAVIFIGGYLFGNEMGFFGIGLFVGAVIYKIILEGFFKTQKDEETHKKFVASIKQHKDDKAIKDFFEYAYGDNWYQKITGEK